SGAVGLQGNEFGQGVPDIGDGYAVLAIDVDLEGKQHQHMRDGPLDGVDALETPGPDRWTHEMNRGYSGRPQMSLEAQIEIRRIHPDKDVGTQREQPPTRVAIGAHQARRPAQGVYIAE